SANPSEVSNRNVEVWKIGTLGVSCSTDGNDWPWIARVENPRSRSFGSWSRGTAPAYPGVQRAGYRSRRSTTSLPSSTIRSSVDAPSVLSELCQRVAVGCAEGGAVGLALEPFGRVERLPRGHPDRPSELQALAP